MERLITKMWWALWARMAGFHWAEAEEGYYYPSTSSRWLRADGATFEFLDDCGAPAVIYFDLTPILRVVIARHPKEGLVLSQRCLCASVNGAQVTLATVRYTRRSAACPHCGTIPTEWEEIEQ